MKISYTYRIDSVDEAARCMVVEYSSTGHQTMMIGARLPFADEELEAVIDMYAPVAYWMEQQTQVVAPTVGATGTITPVVEVYQEIEGRPIDITISPVQL